MPAQGFQDDGFSCSVQEPGSRSRPLHAGRRRGSKQVAPRLIPGPHTFSWFRRHLKHFDASTRVRFHSPSRSVPDAVSAAPFPATLTTPALNRRSSRWFAASSCKATAEGQPPSPAQHRQLASRTHATRQLPFRTHVRCCFFQERIFHFELAVPPL